MVWGLGFDILRSRSHSGGSSVKDLEKFEFGFRGRNTIRFARASRTLMFFDAL